MKKENKEEEINRKELYHLFLKEKKLTGTIARLTEFKEPVVFLIRQNGDIEMEEDIRKKEYHYTHSNGEKRVIKLNEKKMKNMNHGKYRFKCYILDEDNPLPLPEEPIITIQEFTENIEKANSNQKLLEAQAKLKKATLGGWATIAIIIAITIILLVVLWPEQTPTVVKTIVTNISNITQVNPTII